MDPLGIIPTIGSLGAAAIQRNWALKDWNRVNAYNTPKAQVQRLKDAGLPLATMFGGQGGSTAGSVGDTQIDPTLGTAKGLETMFQNRLQRKQLELLDQQIYTEKGRGQREWANALNDKTNADRNLATWNEQSVDYDNLPPNFQPTTTNLAKSVRQGYNMQNLEVIGKQLQNDLAEIQKKLHAGMTQPQIAQAWAQVQHTLNSNSLLQQQFRNQEDFIQFKQRFFESMRKGETDIMSLLVMLLIRAGIGK